VAFSPHIASDYYVSINNVDLSAWAFSVDLKLERDKVDASGFSPVGAKTFLPGQKDEELIVGFRQDFGSGAVNATLAPLYFGGSAFPFTVSNLSTGTRVTFVGSANLYEYHPLDAELGDVADTQVTFAVSGAVTQGTA
jgi:hypothetical protein